MEELEKAKKEIEKYIKSCKKNKKNLKRNNYFKIIEDLKLNGYIVDEINPSSYQIRVYSHKKTMDYWTTTGTISGTNEKGYENLKKKLGK